VAMGDTITGNTTMLLEEGLDTGPILLQKPYSIRPEETAADLFLSLAAEGAPLAVETLAGLEAGSLHPQPQNHAQATLAPILTRDDGRMDFSRTATELLNRWRGFQPWPGAFTLLDGKKFIVHAMRIAPVEVKLPVHAAPGTIHTENHRFFAACSEDTWLEFVEIQLEGKKRMSASDFLRGTQMTAIAFGH